LQSIDSQQPIVAAVYSALRQPPTLLQVQPTPFVKFPTNLLQQYEEKVLRLGRKMDPDEQVRAPGGEIRLAVAEFDFAVDEDMKEEGLPLAEGQEYWIFAWDEVGWSTVAHRDSLNKRGLAPSNHLQPQNVYSAYKWGGNVLLKCGGQGVSEIEIKQSQILLQAEEKKAAERTAVALYDYEAEDEDEDELEFLEGDRLTIAEEVEGGEWFKGVNARTQKSGIYPANYVEEVKQ
jgi:hypothetical protein